MGVYRISVPVTVVIEIDSDNEIVEDRPMLSGDSLVVATRRAVIYTTSHDLKERKALGVRHFLIKGKWETFDASEIAPAYINNPFSPNAAVVPCEVVEPPQDADVS